MVSIHLRRGRKQGCPKVLVILWIFCSEYISRMCGVIVAVALELAGPAIAGPGSNYWAAPLLLLLLDTSPSHLGIYTFHGDFLFTFFFRWGKLKLNLPTQFPNLPVTTMRGLFLPNSTAQCLTHRIRGRKSSERKRGRVGGAYTRKVHSVARLTGAAIEWRHNL